MKHRAQSARAKPEAALAEGIRHRDERLLRCAHDDRQNHDGDRKRTGEQRIAPVQRRHKAQIAEQAVHDGRNARKCFGRDAHELHKFVAALCVFHRVDCRADAERQCNNECDDRHDDCRNQRRHQRHVIRCIGEREKIRCDIRDALHKNVKDQV